MTTDDQQRHPRPHPVRSALRLAAARIPVDVAVGKLRGMANGRGDLLAEQAGLMIDAVSVRPVTAEYRAAVRLLIVSWRRGGPARAAGSRSGDSGD
jgi:hypothetical protein